MSPGAGRLMGAGILLVLLGSTGLTQDCDGGPTMIKYSSSGYDVTRLDHEEIAEIAKTLTPEQVRVTLEAGTEPLSVAYPCFDLHPSSLLRVDGPVFSSLSTQNMSSRLKIPAKGWCAPRFVTPVREHTWDMSLMMALHPHTNAIA